MLYLLALARLLTASPITTTAFLDNTTTTILDTTSLNTLPRRWSGNCEAYCSSLWANQYYPCMQICPKRHGHDTDTDHPSDSDFLDPGDEVPWKWVETDSASGSDWSDFHHKRSLDAFGVEGGTTIPRTKHNNTLLQQTIASYGSLHTALLTIPPSISPPSLSSPPSPVPPTVETSISTHLHALHHALDTNADTTPLTTAFLQHVRNSPHATGKYYARRFEVLARKLVQRELKTVTGRERSGLRKWVREEWARVFGESVWAPRGVLAGVDF